MDLEDLRAAQVDERETDSVQPLSTTFYEQASDFLAELRERRDALAERTDDPFESAEIRRLTDELETAEAVVEALYERRIGKLVKRASLAASGLSVNDEGLTDEERALFRDLVERIEANRATVLDALDGTDDGRSVARHEGDAEKARNDPSDGASDNSDQSTDAVFDTADAMAGSDSDASRPATTDDRSTDDGPEPDGGRSPPDDAAPDRLTVRITADVGEIYGVDDRVYTLGREDVVTLPQANAKPLLERGAAQQLD